MNLDFDLNDVKVIEFGVGRDNGNVEVFTCMAVDADVQAALREMAIASWTYMNELSQDPQNYDPSEKHAGSEHLYLPLDDILATRMRDLHQANNLPMDSNALATPNEVFCYFARMSDGQGRRLTAFRRATHFKGVLKNRLVRLTTNALELINDKVFKLDNDFDMLIDGEHLHILRPSAFEFVGQLQEAILAAVPNNIKKIQADLKYVDFSPIEDYASHHPRAARYLASICSQKDTKNIDKSLLKRLCKTTGVEIKETNGKITVGDGHVMDFLEVIDRRRYRLELIKGSPEQFRAASRQKLGS